MRDEGCLILLGVAVGVAVLAVGCSNDLPKASRLERTRVLGARVQVAADPGRADAQPGEAAAVEWMVASPAAPRALAWAFSVCTSVDGACVDVPGMAGAGTGAPVLAPFTAPAAPTSIDDVHRPLMVGVVCAGGAPTPGAAGAPTPACESTSDSANVVRFSIPMPAPGEAANRHPNLGDDTIELDGIAWTATPGGDAAGPCDGAMGLPTVVAGTAQRRLTLVTDADDRESFAGTAGAAPALEALQLSTFATAGEIEGQYASIDAADTRPDADFTTRWTPPLARDVPAAGLTVAFHFVVRDGRGGLDWTHRALCVVAP